MHRLLAPLLGLCLATGAAAGPFDNLNEADRAALGEEIRRYLLENPEVFLEVVQELEERQAECWECVGGISLSNRLAVICQRSLSNHCPTKFARKR